MVLYLHNQAAYRSAGLAKAEWLSTTELHTLIKLDVRCEQLLQHVMGYCLVSNMFENDFHRRIVRKAAVLVIEAEMCRVEV